MEQQILPPPKLFLDSAHLINISKLRKGENLPEKSWHHAYGFIDECIRERHFGIIFNPSAPTEWLEGRGTLNSASEIAAVIDSAYLKYQLEEDKFIYTNEILQECQKRDSSITVPPLPVLHLLTANSVLKPALGILGNQVPDYVDKTELLPHLRNLEEFPSEVPIGSVRDYVVQAFRFQLQHPEVCRERIDGYKAALAQDMENAGENVQVSARDRLGWMRRFLKVDLVLKTFNPELDVEEALSRVRLEDCPAVKLWFQARQARIRAGHPPTNNEVDDWMFLPVVPYADVVLTDRGFREFILQGDRTLKEKVVAHPDDALKLLEPWT